MAIQYGRNGNAGESRFERNRLRRGFFLPRRTPSPADSFASESNCSVSRDASQESEIEAPPTPVSPVRTTALKPLSPVELHALYAGTTVQPHRYLAPALIAALHSPAIALDPAKWFADLEDVDLSSVVGAWLRTNGDTSFEQLKSVGLDPQASQLTAVLTIKQSLGYLGGPLTAGSHEFVAFWVDWGSGFEYEGTASTVVHDSNNLPVAGLDCRVSLPIDLASHLRTAGDATKLIGVRAVLSWSTPPSISHPSAQAVWGNSLVRRIAIHLQPSAYTKKESEIFTSPRHSDSAFTFSTEDLVERRQALTRFRWEPLDLARDAASF